MISLDKLFSFPSFSTEPMLVVGDATESDAAPSSAAFMERKTDAGNFQHQLDEHGSQRVMGSLQADEPCPCTAKRHHRQRYQ